MSDSYDPVNLPIEQPGNIGDSLGSAVTRQRGLPPAPTPTIDPTPLGPIVQPAPLGDGLGSPVRRNVGVGFFGADGTFFAEGPADDGIVYVDGPMSVQQLPPPGLARTNAALPPPSGFGDMPAAQQPMDRAALRAMAEAAGFIIISDAPGMPPVAGVVASDQPGDAHDPRDKGGAAKVFTADQLPVVKKRAIVPLVLPTPKVKKGGRK